MWAGIADSYGRQLDDARAEIERLRTALRGLVSAVANDETSDTVLRSRVYAEAQHLCANEQSQNGDGG